MTLGRFFTAAVALAATVSALPVGMLMEKLESPKNDSEREKKTIERVRVMKTGVNNPLSKNEGRRKENDKRAKREKAL